MSTMFLRDKYAGSVAGAAWSIIQPVLTLGIYTIVFGFVFGMRLPGAESSMAYVIWLLVGLVPFQSMAEGMTGTASSVLKAEGLVKNILFKSEILPISAAFVALVPLCVGLAFLTILLIVSGHGVSVYFLLVFPTMLVHFLFIVGIGFFLAATSVFVRDVMQALPTLLVLLMFCTPIFYDITMLPEAARKVMVFNPIYQILEGYRASLFHQQPPDLIALGAVWLFSLGLIAAGMVFFRRLRGYFELAL